MSSVLHAHLSPIVNELSELEKPRKYFLPRPAGGEAACRAGPKIVLDHVRVLYIFIYIYMFVRLLFLSARCIRS